MKSVTPLERMALRNRVKNALAEYDPPSQQIVLGDILSVLSDEQIGMVLTAYYAERNRRASQVHYAR